MVIILHLNEMKYVVITRLSRSLLWVKTIVDHRTCILGKPLKNHQCQWSIWEKNIQWWWSGCSKTIEKPSKAMVLRKKNITIPLFEKNDHRWSLDSDKMYFLIIHIGETYQHIVRKWIRITKGCCIVSFFRSLVPSSAALSAFLWAFAPAPSASSAPLPLPPSASATPSTSPPSFFAHIHFASYFPWSGQIWAMMQGCSLLPLHYHQTHLMSSFSFFS